MEKGGFPLRKTVGNVQPNRYKILLSVFNFPIVVEQFRTLFSHFLLFMLVRYDFAFSFFFSDSVLIEFLPLIKFNNGLRCETDNDSC